MKQTSKKLSFDLGKFKTEHGIKGYKVGGDYEIYKSYFPELEYNLFSILDKNGMKGRLWRGQIIDLPWEDIYIRECWWRYKLYHNSCPPCVTKEDRDRIISGMKSLNCS